MTVFLKEPENEQNLTLWIPFDTKRGLIKEIYKYIYTKTQKFAVYVDKKPQKRDGSLRQFGPSNGVVFWHAGELNKIIRCIIFKSVAKSNRLKDYERLPVWIDICAHELPGTSGSSAHLPFASIYVKFGFSGVVLSDHSTLNKSIKKAWEVWFGRKLYTIIIKQVAQIDMGKYPAEFYFNQTIHLHTQTHSHKITTQSLWYNLLRK